MESALKKTDSKPDIAYLNLDIKVYHDVLTYYIKDTILTWDNYGTLWNIDHIKPLGEKGISTNELIERFDWFNTRPMLVKDNRAKYNYTLTKEEIAEAYKPIEKVYKEAIKTEDIIPCIITLIIKKDHSILL
jgi:hypothetical protein